MLSYIKALSNRRMLATLLFGFSSGLPISLVYSTLQAWLKDAKIDLAIIGLVSLIKLPYNFKFLWAPVFDRFIPPFLGHRRGWALIAQIGVIFSLICLASSEPTSSLRLFTWFAVATAIFSASQDIAVDAYKIEILTPTEYGMGAALANLGYRIAMLLSGAFALILADHMPWHQVYLLMAATMSIGVIASLTSPEPEKTILTPKSLKSAVVDPFLDFFKRKGAAEMLAFITIYKLDVVFTLALMTPFLMDMGFSKTDIGTVSKGFGLVAVLAGTFLGGAWITRLGVQRSLWIFGILQGLSGLCFYILSCMGHNYPMMVVTIATENFFSGMGNAAYLAFLMSMCNATFSATQYALLSSLMGISQTFAGAPAGWMVKSVGWSNYFLISLALALPGLALLTRYKKWNAPK